MNAQRLATGLLLAATLVACSDPQSPSAVATPPTSTLIVSPTPSSSATALPTATATTAPDSPDKLAEPYSLTYLQTGGIAGLHMEIAIDSATKKITYAGLRNNQPQSKDLLPDDLAALTRAIEEAHYASFHGPLKGTPFPDAFAYSLTLKAGGKDYAVSWTDGANVPDSLGALRTALVRLRDAKFPAKGTAPTGPTK